jgi:hypothetical protein
MWRKRDGNQGPSPKGDISILAPHYGIFLFLPLHPATFYLELPETFTSLKCVISFILIIFTDLLFPFNLKWQFCSFFVFFSFSLLWHAGACHHCGGCGKQASLVAVVSGCDAGRQAWRMQVAAMAAMSGGKESGARGERARRARKGRFAAAAWLGKNGEEEYFDQQMTCLEAQNERLPDWRARIERMPYWGARAEICRNRS